MPKTTATYTRHAVTSRACGLHKDHRRRDDGPEHYTKLLVEVSLSSCYTKVGPELLEMADEGLVLAATAKARLVQTLSSQHTEGHLQVVGVGEWRPTSTRPAWNAEPRLPPGQEDS